MWAVICQHYPDAYNSTYNAASIDVLTWEELARPCTIMIYWRLWRRGLPAHDQRHRGNATIGWAVDSQRLAQYQFPRQLLL